MAYGSKDQGSYHILQQFLNSGFCRAPRDQLSFVMLYSPVPSIVSLHSLISFSLKGTIREDLVSLQ